MKVIEVPLIEVARKLERSCVETPSARALSWSMSSLTAFDCSFQSKFTLVSAGWARIVVATFSEKARSLGRSSPETRICTG